MKVSPAAKPFSTGYFRQSPIQPKLETEAHRTHGVTQPTANLHVRVRSDAKT